MLRYDAYGGHGGGAFKRKGACYFGVLPGAPCGGALRLLFGTTKLKANINSRFSSAFYLLLE